MWIRKCQIIAEPGNLDFSHLRCRFDIKQYTKETPNEAVVRITNQLPATAKKFIGEKQEFKRLKILAGYEDEGSFGIIFDGDIKYGAYGRETPTDTLTTIWAADASHAYNYATVNKTLAAGSTPKDHVQVAIDAMKQFGVSIDHIGVDLSTPVYPRAVTLFGMARDVISRVARLKYADASLQASKLQMVQHKQPVPGAAIELNSNTGMIGMPTQTMGGIMVRCLINPNIKINTLVHINQSSIASSPPVLDMQADINPAWRAKIPDATADGFYKVLVIDVTGDTRGPPWYMDLTCIGTSSKQPIPEALQIYANPGQI